VSDDLVAFLSARLDEDASGAPGVHLSRCATTPPYHSCDCGYPARVLREVEAGRKILALTFQYDLMIDLLGAVAAVYSDHPDYRAEWAPAVTA
jgi:hypothetical protein